MDSSTLAEATATAEAAMAGTDAAEEASAQAIATIDLKTINLFKALKE